MVAFRRHLTEYGSLAFAPLKSGQQRVDRQAGVIYGLKIAGKQSINKHQVSGVSGTDYTEQAFRDALPLYEGSKVNVDHPKRDPQTGKPLKEDRPSRNRLGKIFGAYLEGGEVYGNLRMLKAHPMYETVMEAAESDDLADCFALSHNAWGKGEVHNGRYVISSIEVQSVDLVADGGTNRSLWESQEQQTMTLRDLLESQPDLKPKYQPLLAIFEDAGDMDAKSGDDYRDHLHNAKKLCEDAGDLETAGKIHKLMAPEKADKSTDGAGDPDDNDPAKKPDPDKKAMESRLIELERKDACRTLCESLDYAPSPLQLKALMALEGADCEALVADFKAGRLRQGPKSRSLHKEPTETQAQESAVPKDADAQLAWLRG